MRETKLKLIKANITTLRDLFADNVLDPTNQRRSSSSIEVLDDDRPAAAATKRRRAPRRS